MKTINVEITKYFIGKGKIDSQECPIALALTEQFPNVYWDVEASRIGYIDVNDHDHAVPMPPAGRDFVHAFDNDGDARPFTLTLELPGTLS